MSKDFIDFSCKSKLYSVRDCFENGACFGLSKGIGKGRSIYGHISGSQSQTLKIRKFRGSVAVHESLPLLETKSKTIVFSFLFLFCVSSVEFNLLYSNFCFVLFYKFCII